MRKSFLIRLRFAAVLVLIAAPFAAVSQPVYAAGYTARAALQEAVKTAQQWRPDAILTSVYTTTADVDGKGVSWSYGFYSPKAHKYLNVTAKGYSVSTLEITIGQTEAVPADFLDSDQVIAEASKAGVKAEIMRMRLTKTEWLVNSGDQKGDLTVWLNPRNGKLIKLQTVE
ncbi:MAG: hypothetical protein HYX73_04715 [Acidobacteria bacterium]|nr:hypothetical protein [Acidobacteriota bacterium]